MARKKRGSGKMKYEYAQDLQDRMMEFVDLLGMDHVDVSRVKCFRSYGSSTSRTIARCHTVGKLMQKAMGMPAHYAIEFLELFEKQSKVDQDKTIIHELMHIPKTFGGGFRQHDHVCEENVNLMYEKFVNLKLKGQLDVKSAGRYLGEESREDNVKSENSAEEFSGDELRRKRYFGDEVVKKKRWF